MVTNLDSRHHVPLPHQPLGWRVNALRNAAIQAEQQAQAQRQRADALALRNRRLRATTAGALGAAGTVGLAMLGLGVLLGYAVGTGLLRAVGP